MASLPIAARSFPKIARKAVQQRSLSDVAITRTGKPIVRVQGGRSVMPHPWLIRLTDLCYTGQVLTWRYDYLAAFSSRRVHGSDHELQGIRRRYSARRDSLDDTLLTDWVCLQRARESHCSTDRASSQLGKDVKSWYHTERRWPSATSRSRVTWAESFSSCVSGSLLASLNMSLMNYRNTTSEIPNRSRRLSDTQTSSTTWWAGNTLPSTIDLQQTIQGGVLMIV